MITDSNLFIHPYVFGYGARIYFRNTNKNIWRNYEHAEMFHLSRRVPLWSRVNIVISHLAGPGSILGWVSFPGWGFSEFFLNYETNVGKT